MDDLESEESSSHLTLLKIDEILDKTRLNSSSSVSVVAFLGLTQNETSASMASIANAILEKNVFGQIACCTDDLCSCHQKRANLLIADENNNGVWMYCDSNKNTIYLLLDSINDSDTFLQLWERNQHLIQSGREFQSWIWKQEHIYMRMLVFIFMVSHVIMLSQPISKLDSNVVSLLRILSSVKRHIMSHASNFMSMCWQNWGISSPYGTQSGGYSGRAGISQGSALAPGRCVPFLLFLFQEVQLPSNNPSDGSKSDAVYDKAASVFKRIKDALQTRIRFLFRTCHLVQTNDLHASFDGRQLFTLPPPSSQFFVHLVTRASTGNLLSTNPALSILSASMSNKEKTNPPDLEALLKKRRLDARGAENFEIKLLREFALGWIKWAGTGYPRSFIKRGMAANELPNARQWISGCIALQELLFGNLAKELLDRKSFGILDDTLKRRLKECLQINNRYSSSHCAQILRKAIDVYLLESPTYYAKTYHEMKLEHALRYYTASARGPAVQEYAEKLHTECQNIWERGRQKCEIESLSGHECVLGANHDSDEKATSNVMKAVRHRSAFQALHACNCGKSRREREDAFDLVNANINFFKFSDCCKSEENYLSRFPHTKSHFREMWSLIHLGSSSLYRPKSGLEKWDGFVTNANFLLPWGLTLMENLQQLQEHFGIMKDMHGREMDADIDKIKTNSKGEKASVLTSKAGKQRTKNPDDGKNDDGDWPLLGGDRDTSKSGSAVQQYADVVEIVTSSRDAKNQTIKNADSNKEKRNRKGGRNNHKKECVDLSASISLADNEQVRGHVGVEYECPHGHRFMNCSEGQVCKLGHTGHTQETAMNLLSQDLPIFILCPCNNTASGPPVITAQLQRIIIVTSDTSLTIILNPVVKDRTNKDCIVSSLFESTDNHQFNGIVLPRNSMMVLRLPYIHYDQKGQPLKPEKDISKRISTLYLSKNFLFYDTIQDNNENSSIT